MQMFIVARRHPELYDYLSAQFADDPTVTVVLDRRLASRRRRALPAAAERRRIDRRWRPEIDEQLRATPLAIVTAATTAEPGRGAPASEARQWVEALHRGVKAVHSALDEHLCAPFSTVIRRPRDATTLPPTVSSEGRARRTCRLLARVAVRFFVEAGAQL